jgi:dihydropteroate synthase
MTNRACLAGIGVGDGLDVVVMGALNVSPESFYPESVATREDDLLRTAEAMARAGAAFVDIGAMSTAPYLAARIPESEEADRLAWAVDLVASAVDVPISVDTSRVGPARAALGAGARIINDVTGLVGDPRMPEVAAGAGIGLILGASEDGEHRGGDPIEVVRNTLAERLAVARSAGVDPCAVVVDPGIGFFRHQGMPWHEWDCRVLARLEVLRVLGRPVCVGVSRKSFIGALAGGPQAAERLPGSLAATAAAVLNGAQLIRAHDVGETVQAVRVAEAISRARQEG